ncbi:Hsp70 family protein [Actinoplanes sp. NBC_00393]|uniref:Hsp70 family protein n=1 Tax=Actinoplanes sp. NBC_00393 TaxID=2975953 RepID=UPI002E1C8B90
MPAADLRLAVDIAAWWTTAVYESAGTLRPVFFDGQARLPSGVYQNPDTRALTIGTPALAASAELAEGYRPDPMTLLHTGTPAPDARFDPVAALAALLAHVAEAATAQARARVTELIVVTARRWGPSARQRLDRAATGAGLPTPEIVTVAAAAAVLAGAAPAGPFITVCTTGEATPELTVVDAAHGYRQLATAPVRDPGSPTVDEALIRLAAERASPGTDPAAALDDWRVAREIQQARTALAVQPVVPTLLPEPHPAVVLTREDLTAATATHLSRLDEAVKRLLADAALARGDIGPVVLVGDDGALPAVEAGLSAGGLLPAVTIRDPHAIVTGALRLGPPTGRPWRAWPWRRR